MHSHGHSHGGINEGADWLTNLGALGEAIEGGANFFFGATVYNTLYELLNGHENEDKFGWPLYIGIVLGVISMGSAYTHRSLDTYHQRVRQNDNHSKEHKLHGDSCNHQHEESTRDIELGSLSQPLNPALHSSEAGENKTSLPTPRLTGMQRFTLFGDATSHVFARAGLVAGIADGLAMTFANTGFSAVTKGLVQLGGVFFGAATSASSIRTCRNAMLEQNQQRRDSSQAAPAAHGLNNN